MPTSSNMNKLWLSIWSTTNIGRPINISGRLNLSLGRNKWEKVSSSVLASKGMKLSKIRKISCKNVADSKKFKRIKSNLESLLLSRPETMTTCTARCRWPARLRAVIRCRRLRAWGGRKTRNGQFWTEMSRKGLLSKKSICWPTSKCLKTGSKTQSVLLSLWRGFKIVDPASDLHEPDRGGLNDEKLGARIHLAVERLPREIISEDKVLRKPPIGIWPLLLANQDFRADDWLLQLFVLMVNWR